MTKSAYFRDWHAFMAEVASEESEKLALIARRKETAARGFAARAAAARAARSS